MQNVEDRVRKISFWRYSWIYLLTVVLGHFLFAAVWGLVNGVVVAPRIASDPDFQKQLAEILTKEDLDKLNTFHVPSRVHELPVAKKSAIERLTRKHLEGVNWLGIHLVANAVTFSLLGLILGVLRVHKYVFLVPICLLPATLTILGAEQFFVGI
jgi:hypothetical protein